MAMVGSQPNSKAWELSLYELHRKPHDMVSDETAIAVSPRALHSELMCPICLDLMTCTLTTKECLHRFCQDCIITALRSGNKECPTCRKKLVSKRSLRADPNFDALIAKIYPNRDELNAQQTVVRSRSQVSIVKRKRKLDASVSPPALESHEEKRQKTQSVVETTKQVEGISDQQPLQPLGGYGTEEVELQLRPHPHDPSVSEHAIRDLSTHPVATVAHLAKYLSIYPMLESEKDNKTTAVRALHFNGGGGGSHTDKKFTLYIQLNSDSDFTVLPNGTSLKQICENYWLPGDKLKIYFAIDERLASQS